MTLEKKHEVMFMAAFSKSNHTIMYVWLKLNLTKVIFRKRESRVNREGTDLSGDHGNIARGG